MCGIIGVVGEIANAIGDSLYDLLSHRGPDGHGSFIKKNVHLAHTRLSIIDPEGGNQPMVTPDERLAVTYNGEIYNYLHIRRELERSGHVFQTKSDTEVLLYAYSQWGKECLDHLRGMFAFAIADYEKQVLFLSRDQLGIKPLVYSFAGEHFSFASEIQALLAFPWVKKKLEPNPQGIYELLRFAYTSAPNSAYKHIYKLPPAHWIEINLKDPSRQIDPTRYWQIRHNPDESLSSEDCEELVDTVVRESVKSHLISDVPFGAFLSGGLDSTLVVAYMSEILDEPVRSFSIGFEEVKYDERMYAKVSAQKLGTQHYEEIVKSNAMDLIPKLVKHYGEPFGDSSAIPTWHVSRLARNHVPMVLSGDGGDEFFGGYHSYRSWLTQLDPNSQSINGPRWKILARIILSRLMPQHYPPKINSTCSLLDRWMDIVGFFKSHQIDSLLSEDFFSSIKLHPETMKLAFSTVDGEPHLTLARNADIYNYLPNDILVKVDIASMMHGLEVRTPLTDIRIAELSGRIPWDRLIERREDISGWTGKLPIRGLLSKKFDNSFINRKKQGFGIPVVEWLFSKNKNAKEMLERIVSPNARIYNWLRPSAVKNVLNKKLGYHTWHLVIFEEWLEQNKF